MKKIEKEISNSKTKKEQKQQQHNNNTTRKRNTSILPINKYSTQKTETKDWNKRMNEKKSY